MRNTPSRLVSPAGTRQGGRGALYPDLPAIVFYSTERLTTNEFK